jgi:hypothetical protein
MKQYMSYVRGEYKIHDSLADAKAYEREHLSGFTNWSGDTPQRHKPARLLLALVLLGSVTMLPILGTLAFFWLIN